MYDRVEIKSADELADAIERGFYLFDCAGNSYRKARPPYMGFIKVDEDDIEYIIPSIEFERSVYFIVKEKICQIA